METMRKDVRTEETWDLSLLYSGMEEIERDMAEAEALSREIEAMKGTLDTPERIVSALDRCRRVEEILGHLFSYASLWSSVDAYDSEAQNFRGRIEAFAFGTVITRLSFLDDELSTRDVAVLERAAEMEKADACRIRRGIRERDHKLSAEGEKVLSALRPVLDAPENIYNMAKLGDMVFPSFNVGGKEYPMGYSLYEDDYEYSPDTAVRREAAKVFYSTLRSYVNVTAAAYGTEIQKRKIIATLKGFESLFDEDLFFDQVERSFYERHLDTIMEKLSPVMRRYARLKRKVLGVDKLSYFDLKVPLDNDYAPSVTWEECRSYALRGLSVLGDDYVEMVREAFDNRWFDRAKNQGKCTGGFCATPYRRNSFILFSFNEKMSDVFTAVHELGHAGHFKTCGEAQSIFDTEVSRCFVEAPSTTNELIFSHYLLENSPDDHFSGWVYDNMIANTYYHNFVTHFLEAWWQREVLRVVDKGGSLSAEDFSRLFRETLERFWGDDVVLEEGSELTWMRQPHYYMGLYSYTYSVGLTIGTEVSSRIVKEGGKAVEDWKRVLALGSTLPPMELAAAAGVDLSTSAPLEHTIATISSYVDELEKIYG